jgi:hypothetical protein
MRVFDITRRWIFFGAALAAACVTSLVACDDTECAAGRQTSCACPNNAPAGFQICGDDGSYGSCVCGGGGSGGATSSTGGGSTTTGGMGGTTTTATGGQGGSGGTGGAPCGTGERLCSNTCIDVTGDANNCGDCGHDCLGGSCTNGLCAADTIAMNQQEPFALVLDGTNVYWTSAGAQNRVFSAPLGGGSPQQLATGQGDPREIALDNGVLYWANFGIGSGNTASIAHYSLPNGPASQLVSSLPTGAWGIAVDGTHVYWANQTAGTISRDTIGTATGAQELASALQTPWDVVIDNTHVYWTDYDGSDVRRVPKGGGTQQVLANGLGRPLGLTRDGGNLFWADSGQDKLVQFAVAGMTQLVLADVQTSPSAVAEPTYVATDGTHLYWTNFAGGASAAGSVARVPVGGGNVTIMADGQTEPYHIAVDGTHVYWTTLAGGTVMRVPK